jgi:hypothetical protein
VTSGLISASGLMLLNVRYLSVLGRLSILFLATLVILNLVVWLLYLFGQAEPDLNRGFQFLLHPAMLLLIAGIGHILPILHMGAVFLSGDLETSIITTPLFRVGLGLMLMAGSACQKIGVVMAAGFFRPIWIDAEIRDNTLTQRP